MYDNIGHVRAIREARRCGMPGGIIKATIGAYRQARFVQIDRRVGCGIQCSRGVIAGCALATTWAKIVLVNGLDSIFAKYRDRAVDIGVYVDDITVAIVGTTREDVVTKARAVACELREFIVEELRGVIACGKAATFGNSPTLARQLCGIAGCPAAERREPIALGVDVGAGRQKARNTAANWQIRTNRAGGQGWHGHQDFHVRHFPCCKLWMRDLRCLSG